MTVMKPVIMFMFPSDLARTGWFVERLNIQTTPVDDQLFPLDLGYRGLKEER